MKGLMLGFFMGALGVLAAQMAQDAYRTKRGPFDAVVHDQAYCAASMQHIGKRIILDGAELGPCTTKDIGRKP